MKYRLQIVRSAERQFCKLPPVSQDRIAAKIHLLEIHPRPHGSQKLHSTDYYRIRIGDYRVIYSLDDKRKIVKILCVGHRREIYR